MSATLQKLVCRKRVLVARAAQERGTLCAQTRALAGPGRIVERALIAASAARAHPVMLAGAAAVLVLFPRGVTRWAGRAWMMWRSFRALREWLRSSAAA